MEVKSLIISLFISFSIVTTYTLIKIFWGIEIGVHFLCFCIGGLSSLWITEILDNRNN